MATAITLTRVPLSGGVALPVLQALAADGATIEFDEQDTKILILVENSSTTGNITFKAGSGLAGVADLVVSVNGSTTMAFVLESAAFKNAGKVIVTGATTMKVGALLLP